MGRQAPRSAGCEARSEIHELGPIRPSLAASLAESVWPEESVIDHFEMTRLYTGPPLEPEIRSVRLSLRCRLRMLQPGIWRGSDNWSPSRTARSAKCSNRLSKASLKCPRVRTNCSASTEDRLHGQHSHLPD